MHDFLLNVAFVGVRPHQQPHEIKRKSCMCTPSALAGGLAWLATPVSVCPSPPILGCSLPWVGSLRQTALQVPAPGDRRSSHCQRSSRQCVSRRQGSERVDIVVRSRIKPSSFPVLLSPSLLISIRLPFRILILSTDLSDLLCESIYPALLPRCCPAFLRQETSDSLFFSNFLPRAFSPQRVHSTYFPPKKIKNKKK